MVVGSSPTRSIIILEDYPSPAEGNGLENRQACKSVRGFESHILRIISKFEMSSQTIFYIFEGFVYVLESIL